MLLRLKEVLLIAWLSAGGGAVAGGLLLSQSIAQGTAPSVTAILNTASYASGPVAPGEIVVVQGSLMGPDSIVSFEVDATGNVPNQLAGVRVLFDETAAPLIYVSSSYVATIVPYSTFGKNATTLQVEYLGSRSSPVIIPIALSAPGIFTAAASGQGQAIALDQD